MHLKKEVEYCIRILRYLGNDLPEKEEISVKQLARRINVPMLVCLRLVHVLDTVELLTAYPANVPNPYCIANEATRSCTLYDVVIAVEGQADIFAVFDKTTPEYQKFGSQLEAMGNSVEEQLKKLSICNLKEENLEDITSQIALCDKEDSESNPMENLFPQNELSGNASFDGVFAVKVHRFDDHVALGKIRVGCFKEPIPFIGIGHLMLLMDDILNYVNKPEAHVRYRYYTQRYKPYSLLDCATLSPTEKVEAKTIKLTDDDAPCPKGCVCFSIRVIQRAHGSLQGILKCSEEKEQLSFRSELELMRVMTMILKNHYRKVS